jgi:hypothetical protein
MQLLRELISIPERVYQGDFVLQFRKGVPEPEQTLCDSEPESRWRHRAYVGRLPVSRRFSLPTAVWDW